MSLQPDVLVGSYTPLVTPFIDGKIDEDSYANLVQFQRREGSRGIVVCGTSGEPSLLTIAERQRLADVAIEAAAGTIPVVVATGAQSLAETEALTEHAVKRGADALLIVTPYYSRPSERGLIEYFVQIGRTTEIPWLLYHIPGRAAVGVTIAGLEAIAARCDSFVGIKHAAPDLGLVSECLLSFGEQFRVMVGLEELSFPMLALGASGVINAVGNVAPRQVQALCDAVAAQDLQLARKLHYELFALNRAVFWDTNPVPVKYLMRLLGVLPRNEHRLPMLPASPELEKRLDDLARRVGLTNAQS